MMRIDGGGSVRTDPVPYAPPPPPPEQPPPASPSDFESAAAQERLTAAAPYFGGDQPHWRYTSGVPQPSPGPAPTPPAPTPGAEPPAPPENRPGAGEVMGPALGAAAVAAAADGPIPVGDVIAIGILVGGAIALASASEGGGELPEVPQVEPQPTPGPETAMPDPSTLTNEQKRDWVTDPENLRGRSPEEIESMIPDSWARQPAREGGGVRYANPERNGEQVRIMEPPEHLPEGADPVKQGPYARVSRDGTTSDPIPLDGNPTLPR